MPLRQLALNPGINRQLSPTLEAGGYSDGNMVRFPYGVPQPIGGWSLFNQTALRGIARALHAWSQLDASIDLAVGTNLRLLLYRGGAVFDITPSRSLAVAIGGMTTTAGSAAIGLASANHGCAVGDYIEVPAGTMLGGLTLGGEYPVASVPDSGHLTFDAAAPATATAANTAALTVTALLSPGFADAQVAGGWGAGAWGGGSWGTPRSMLIAAGAVRLWSLDNWGEELVACARGNGIYNWKPINGTASYATAIPGAPAQVNVILVGMPERHLIAFGSEQGGVFDPMLIQWSDVEDYTTWGATATNSAGSFRLAAGNRIVGVLSVSQEILVFTESNVYAMRFVGLPYVYTFLQIEADHTGLIAQNAAVGAGNGNVFWMGFNSFWTYAGAAILLPCLVWDAIFDNLNWAQKDKIVAGSNAGFSEVLWCYPSAGSQENDSVVVYDYKNQTWSIWELGRTAWLDVGVLQYPTAADPVSGLLFSHEVGQDANGQPLPASVTTGFMDISDGDQIMSFDKIVPDFSDQAGTVQVTVDAKKWPDDPVASTKGPFPMDAATRYLSPRMRGRQMALTIASQGAGCFWRLGKLRVRIAPSGRQ